MMVKGPIQQWSVAFFYFADNRKSRPRSTSHYCAKTGYFN